ncbi:hypothetical protein [Winogradskyella aurantiaca]|uniref:hypothetical protein n=1 Tax=Winogradskyella aurantiaca TaxID=2219558 RepID=UPI0013001911|nr:hypothetical protein [Winogradskyella aurantiaca]
MKTLFIALTFMLMSFQTNAQMTIEDYQMEQEIYKMEKREIFEEFIGEVVNKDFWATYNEYEAKRFDLEMRRFEIVKNYSQDYFNMSNEQAASHLKLAEKLNIDFNRLMTQYSNKFIKSHGGKVAMQFYQLELYFLAVSRTELIENIPTVAEMLKD